MNKKIEKKHAKGTSRYGSGRPKGTHYRLDLFLTHVGLISYFSFTCDNVIYLDIVFVFLMYNAVPLLFFLDA